MVGQLLTALALLLLVLPLFAAAARRCGRAGLSHGGSGSGGGLRGRVARVGAALRFVLLFRLCDGKLDQLALTVELFDGSLGGLGNRAVRLSVSSRGRDDRFSSGVGGVSNDGNVDVVVGRLRLGARQLLGGRRRRLLNVHETRLRRRINDVLAALSVGALCGQVVVVVCVVDGRRGLGEVDKNALARGGWRLATRACVTLCVSKSRRPSGAWLHEPHITHRWAPAEGVDYAVALNDTACGQSITLQWHDARIIVAVALRWAFLFEWLSW
ncbi:hypothetical protein CC85DRAFT_143690 [Cutaneotrichosporon oleaginosum]|uniref:Secreted protein n=1 Tax=Cutaneotrichosporon oleaginosum TaxID=879819 RepID=A0A0J1AZC1_9TREE|nr:uncharacterized protein CC85DRAFT_143690 [Cutaneotrichosporon oleaginosum]KLT40689.1 hypothetical protein CC85DRAFT_143690 [Cutaneotrichosporon oleaginosum]TXT14260.1 hypothetical protein COLE_00453 [Cutaneotrichosporon oleaginosum]